MGVGKYSPTVNRWYDQDQQWHDKHCAPDEWIDRDGYDMYGYHHVTQKDRAGYTEMDYMSIWRRDEHDDIEHTLYNRVYETWREPMPGNCETQAPSVLEYRVIARKGNTVNQFAQAHHAAAWLLGRRISECMLIKTDHKGDRVVDVSAAGGDVAQIQTILEQA